MGESSTTEVKNDKPAEAGSERMVPVAAVGDARAKTRAAEAETSRLQTELDKLKGEKIDIGELSKVVADMVLDVRKQVEAEFAPVRAEAAKLKLAQQMGLNEAQVDKVVEMRAKHPGLNDQDALLLARSNHADLFPQPTTPAWNRALHGAVPVTGFSQARNEGAPVDYTAKMNEAAAKGDRVAAKEFAALEFAVRLHKSFPNQTRAPR